MSDNIKNDNQQFELSDTELAKIAAALLGVEYPGDEYFDGTKETDSVSTVKVVAIESEVEPQIEEQTSLKEEVLNEVQIVEELPEVNYTERVRSTPFRKQSFSAWQSARLRNFAKAGIIKTEVEEEIEHQEELTFIEEPIVFEQNDVEELEEGVITINDILGENASVMEHEPDLLAMDDEKIEPETLEEEVEEKIEQGEIEVLDQVEVEETIEEIPTQNQEEQDEIVENDFDVEESAEDDGDQIERLKMATPIIPVVISIEKDKDDEIIEEEEYEAEEDSIVDDEDEQEIENDLAEEEEELIVEPALKPKRKERVAVEDIREITICEKKNKEKTSLPPVMPEYNAEKPMYFACIQTKPQKIRRRANAPHVVPSNSKPVEFSPKGGAYREI